MPLQFGNTEIEEIRLGSTEIEEARLGTIPVFPNTVGQLLLDTFSVTEASASGTAANTLNAVITGSEGAMFTLNQNGRSVTFTPSGGSATTTGTIPSGGTLNITFSLAAQSQGASARTVTYEVVNTGLVTNTLTDTVTQGAGPAIPDRNPVGSVTVSSITADGVSILGGSIAAGTYTVVVTGTYSVTTAASGSGDTRGTFQFQQLGGLDRDNISGSLRLDSIVTNQSFTLNGSVTFNNTGNWSWVVDINPGGFFEDNTSNTAFTVT